MATARPRATYGSVTHNSYKTDGFFFSIVILDMIYRCFRLSAAFSKFESVQYLQPERQIGRQPDTDTQTHTKKHVIFIQRTPRFKYPNGTVAFICQSAICSSRAVLGLSMCMSIAAIAGGSWGAPRVSIATRRNFIPPLFANTMQTYTSWLKLF